MLPSTLDVLKSVLRANPTLSPAEREFLLVRMREKPADSKVGSAPKEEARIVRCIEATERLSCSTRTLDKLAASGVPPRRKLPGHVKLSGFLASDIEALIATRMLLPST